MLSLVIQSSTSAARRPTAANCSSMSLFWSVASWTGAAVILWTTLSLIAGALRFALSRRVNSSSPEPALLPRQTRAHQRRVDRPRLCLRATRRVSRSESVDHQQTRRPTEQRQRASCSPIRSTRSSPRRPTSVILTRCNARFVVPKRRTVLWTWSWRARGSRCRAWWKIPMSLCTSSRCG
jgi:hypothetical protein